MSFPIFNINIRKTRNKQFKFLLGEDRDEVGWNNIMET